MTALRADGKLWTRLRPGLDDLPAALASAKVYVPLMEGRDREAFEEKYKGDLTPLALRAIEAQDDFKINLDDVQNHPDGKPGARENTRARLEPVMDGDKPRLVGKARRPVMKRVPEKFTEPVLVAEGGWIVGFKGDYICQPIAGGPAFAVEAAEFLKRFRPAAPKEVKIPKRKKE